MPNTNGHGPKRAILYARVSTDEQARSGFSLAQQLDALRAYAVREGYEVLEEIQDPGQSGASLERPGMDRVRDLVAAGKVSVVLAQDRDRIAREPAYHYLLREEFAEHGTKIRAMNDRGDESPEGELTDGILDQLAKFERAKTAERSRRGKLQKAREGKVIATNKITFGFRYNENRDGLLIEEDNIAVVRRIIRMVGAEGVTMHQVKKTLQTEGVPAPNGGRYWNKKSLKRMLMDDIYLPHTPQEIGNMVEAGQMSPGVAARLDPEKSYGIWYYNRRRTIRRRVAETDENGERRYVWRQKIVWKPREEWVAVPVPDSGIPRQWADAACNAVKDNPSVRMISDYRVYELDGVFACGVCGRRMTKNRKPKSPPSEGYYYYYICPSRINNDYDSCAQVRGFRAEPVEEQVWEAVRSLMLEPAALQDALERMVEEERSVVRGDPDRDVRRCLEQLAAHERKRSGFQDMAAEGLITLDELRSKLAGLEELRRATAHELEAARGREERLRHLEDDRESLLRHYENIAPEALDSLTSEERQQLYRLLRLKLTAGPPPERELTLTGILGEELSGVSETNTWVIPLLLKSVSRSSGMRERSPSTIARTMEASWGRKP
ncbi:recombinase family protein [soil metagenome]